ncbi:3-O-methyltransferase 2 [Hypsizygus marmoreus]|uniref:3-O-methyltransferase 2 n=1 Tax=Hypsizygus marmoreus TaxID=39966 RepID=A0A369JLW2_HYPMA|nr:3-O-methyltransferase 2 [Hypsizygus marmoreus]
MSYPHGQVSALVALIVSSSKTIEAHYAKSSKPYVPSLDDLAPHPLDSELSPSEVREAVQILEGACAQLCATVARPNHTVLNKLMQIYEPGCLQVAITFKIPDILLETPQGMHISEIASKHLFREVRTDVFANNRLSLELLSTAPLNGLAFHFTDENNKAVTRLPDVLADSQWGHSQSAVNTAWNKSTGFPGSLFEWFEGATPEGAKQGARFGLGMIGWGNAIEAGGVVTAFPWRDLPPGSTVCDVGGGIGNITMQLAKMYPHLKLKLQDTPDRITQAATNVWPAECPLAIVEDRIEFKAMDFFVESPIKGCDIYYLKNIIHDWPARECIKILSGVRNAMKSTSRVLIHEHVLQHADRVAEIKSAFAQAPEPLLPNYGVGRIRQYSIDLDMMVMLNSKERTLEEFTKLGGEAGLKFVKLWDVGELGVVEFCLAA